MVERIVAAALIKNGVVYSLPRPARHDSVIRHAHQALGLSEDPMESLRDDGQGFVTSEGRYVDRVEGARIAISSGQVRKLKWPPLLYSEDLW